jgi:predicted O-methyltransferase YrrM
MPTVTSRAGKFFRRAVADMVAPLATSADLALRRPEFALRRELQRRATLEAADIVARDMPDAMFCADRLVNLDYALGLKPPGLMLEFGVYKGETITFIAGKCPEERIYGFDSFHGLPEHWSGNRFSYKNFDRRGVLPKVPQNVELVSGWFNETVPPFLAAHPGPVGFVHVDCDIYSSTRTVLTALNGRLAPNAVIVFDEFFNYHGYRQHEHRAFFEFVAETGRAYRFVSFSGQQAAVVLGA